MNDGRHSRSASTYCGMYCGSRWSLLRMRWRRIGSYSQMRPPGMPAPGTVRPRRLRITSSLRSPARRSKSSKYADSFGRVTCLCEKKRIGLAVEPPVNISSRIEGG